MEIWLFGWIFFSVRKNLFHMAARYVGIRDICPTCVEKSFYTFTVSLTHLGNVRLTEQMICASWMSWVAWAQTEEAGSKCPAAANHWTHWTSRNEHTFLSGVKSGARESGDIWSHHVQSPDRTHLTKILTQHKYKLHPDVPGSFRLLLMPETSIKISIGILPPKFCCFEHFIYSYSTVTSKIFSQAHCDRDITYA